MQFFYKINLILPFSCSLAAFSSKFPFLYVLICSILSLIFLLYTFLTFLIKTNFLISFNMTDLAYLLYLFIPYSYTYFLAETNLTTPQVTLWELLIFFVHLVVRLILSNVFRNIFAYVIAFILLYESPQSALNLGSSFFNNLCVNHQIHLSLDNLIAWHLKTSVFSNNWFHINWFHLS